MTCIRFRELSSQLSFLIVSYCHMVIYISLSACSRRVSYYISRLQVLVFIAILDYCKGPVPLTVSTFHDFSYLSRVINSFTQS